MEPLHFIRTYDDLHQALRARSASLKVARETLDEIAGLGNCYVNKLIGPTPIKQLGKISLGALLGAMGVMLVLVEDPDALARVGKRLKKARNAKLGKNTDGTVPTRKRRKRKPYWTGNSDWGRWMRKRAIAKQSAITRSKLARHAVNARWARLRALKRLAHNGSGNCTPPPVDPLCDHNPHDVRT